MLRRVLSLVSLAMILNLAACGDDDSEADEASATTTTTEATTTTTEATTTTAETSDTTQPGPGSCPDDTPIPGDATAMSEAPVAYDGDGDGSPDTLSVYEQGGDWWLHVEWATGGTAATMIESAGTMGARPLGGHDLGGDGSDEAWVAISGPASGSIVGIYRTDGCDLVPVLDADMNVPFEFTVTASIGTISGATCEGIGAIDLFTGELEDADAGEYMIGQAPYSYDGSALTAEFGDAGSATSGEIGQFAGLDCGDLASAL